MSHTVHRRIGAHRGPDGRFTRVVERLEIHGAPISFQTLSERAIPEDSRYVILDLDRTVHLGRNMGELLGWELIAHHVYGPERLEASLKGRAPGRFMLLGSDPLASLAYLRAGVRLWAWPGLYYFGWCKLAKRIPRIRKMSYRRFGPDPVSKVQRLPQSALLSQMSSVPLAELRSLAQGVWARHQGDQVITREDIDALRARCPQASIIISSASPQPVLETAAEALGVDDIVFSKVDVEEGFLSAPFWLQRLMGAGDLPRRITPPSRQRMNVSYAKVEALLERYPDLLDPDVVTVGISDTGYGEDHCWAQYFTHVVDVNSSDPFPPIVAADAPLRSVHSAALLTRDEIAMQRRSPGWLSPSRGKAPTFPPRRTYDADALTARLAGEIDTLESLGARLESRALDLTDPREALTRIAEEIAQAIDDAAESYNSALGAAKTESLTQLRRWLAESRALSRRVAQLERPLSEATYALTQVLESARSALA